MAIKDVLVPDLGGVSDVDVIEILVSPGDKVNKEDSLLTLESDKASMEIPSPYTGTVKAINVKLNQKISENDLVLTMDVTDVASDDNADSKQEPNEEIKSSPSQDAPQKTTQEVYLPDLGGVSDVDVIEVLVSPGDEINKEDSLVTLETDKASMEVPSPYSGKIKEIKLAVGDKVNEGDLVLLMEDVIVDKSVTSAAAPSQPAKKESAISTSKSQERARQTQSISNTQATLPNASTGNGISLHAGPAVRRLARELGVDLALLQGSGRKKRILKSDIHLYVKTMLSGRGPLPGGSGGLTIAPAREVDFSRFGEIELQPLTKIKKLTGKYTHRSWVTIPHVTQFDEADITELEAFRKKEKVEAEKQGFKLTPLVFLMKAVVECLKQLPAFNSSLDNSGENLILKKYFNIGIAVDTPNGLVVAVVRDVDQKSIFDLGKELGEISKKAREKGLSPADMQGSCFTISSLGGIGGTAFTPVVNAPDVAILGVSRSKIKPVYKEGEFVPRLMLPLSLSYDHRVIDGAQAARFTTLLGRLLGDIRELLL